MIRAGIAKAWMPLTSTAIGALPAQLGVYEVADTAGSVLRIGYAGGRDPFGMRSALTAELDRAGATHFRHEFTHGYLTRWQELLMIHRGVHGSLPPGNSADAGRVGRLAVGRG